MSKAHPLAHEEVRPRPAALWWALATLGICQGLLASPAWSQNFKIIGPGPRGGAVPVLDPTDLPPFCHWDLRVHADCEVDFRINMAGTGDVAGDDAVVGGNVTTGADGICETEAAAGDAQAIPLGEGNPDQVCITDGGNGLDSVAGGDDQVVGATITTGADGICESVAAGNDAQAIPYGQGQAHVDCVTGGNTALANATPEIGAIKKGYLRWNDVAPSIFDWSYAGTTPLSEAVDGTNVADFLSPTALDHPELDGAVALTYLTCDLATGIVTDADVLFNDNLDFAIGRDGGTCAGGINAGQPCATGADCPGSACANVVFDVEATAAHEAGHALGLHHSDKAVATMSNTFPPDLTKRTLDVDDSDGDNFLYTPDLGDAPDPPYPSLVHGAGSLPDNGAAHLFGWRRSGADFQLEWLGADMDNHPAECEARVVDLDAFDDGVTFLPFVALRGAPLAVTVTVTALPATGDHLRDADHLMYLNAWFDLNGNGVWESPAERLIQDTYVTGDTRTYAVAIPVFAPETIWSRFRLDYRENVGDAPATIEPGLMLETGAAQFGEVEDYPIGAWAGLPWTFSGTAEGGFIDFVVSVVPGTFEIPFRVVTTAGQSPESVAAAIAAEINRDFILAEFGIIAFATGPTVVTNAHVSGLVVNDPGLSHLMDYPPIFSDGFESGDVSVWPIASGIGGPRD